MKPHYLKVLPSSNASEVCHTNLTPFKVLLKQGGLNAQVHFSTASASFHNKAEIKVLHNSVGSTPLCLRTMSNFCFTGFVETN